MYDCVHYRYPLQVEMDYRDGDLLNARHLEELRAFIDELKKNKLPTLVHCHAGACRSPTVAAYLLGMVDGTHPIDAFAAVEKAIFDQQEKHDGGKICNTIYQVKRQLAYLIHKNNGF